MFLLVDFLLLSAEIFIRRAHRFGFPANTRTVSELLDNVARHLFNNIQRHGHCLNIVLSEERNSSQYLRPWWHQFHLPSCTYKFYKDVLLLTVVCLNFCSSSDVLCFAFTFVLGNKTFTYLLICCESMHNVCYTTGLPWGWHFNPHTHPIPTGIPIGIPMGIPIGLPTEPEVSTVLHVGLPSPIGRFLLFVR